MSSPEDGSKHVRRSDGKPKRGGILFGLQLKVSSQACWDCKTAQVGSCILRRRIVKTCPIRIARFSSAGPEVTARYISNGACLPKVLREGILVLHV